MRILNIYFYQETKSVKFLFELTKIFDIDMTTKAPKIAVDNSTNVLIRL